MFCSKCGQQNNDDARFCLKCGSPLVQSAEPAKVTSVIEEPTQQTIINSVAENKEQSVNQEYEVEQSKSVPEKKKKGKKKTIIIVTVVLALLIAVTSFLYVDGYIRWCYKCRTIEFDTNGYRRYNMCLTHLYEEVGGTNLYSGATSTETFGFYSDYYFDEFDKEHSSDEGAYFYQWSSSEHPVEIEVEISEVVDGGCTTEDFKVAFDDAYETALNDENDEDVSMVKKDILYNYDMVEIWQDGYLEIVTYTDNAYYSFQVFTDDQECMENLCYSIKKAVIDIYPECVLVD